MRASSVRLHRSLNSSLCRWSCRQSSILPSPVEQGAGASGDVLAANPLPCSPGFAIEKRSKMRGECSGRVPKQGAPVRKKR